jgi:hypothetical protein
VPKNPNQCSADLTQSIDSSGKATDCGAFRCDEATGLCRQVCTTTGDCGAGFVCEPASKTCVAASGEAPEQEEGCACHAVGGGGPRPWPAPAPASALLMALAAVACSRGRARTLRRRAAEGALRVRHAAGRRRT